MTDLKSFLGPFNFICLLFSPSVIPWACVAASADEFLFIRFEGFKEIALTTAKNSGSFLLASFLTAFRDMGFRYFVDAIVWLRIWGFLLPSNDFIN